MAKNKEMTYDCGSILREADTKNDTNEAVVRRTSVKFVVYCSGKEKETYT